MEFWRTTRRWRPLSLWLLFLLVQLHLCTSTLVEDYEQCRDHQQFSRPNGSLVCDPEGRLQPKAVAQLHGMLRDLEKNVPCDCVDGCARGTDHGSDKFMALLLVSSSERVEQSGGIEQLNDTAQHIWDDAGMGSEQCDNGMLLIYLRDQRKMATYQGHQRFKLFSDQEIANLHELAMNGGLTNGTANVSALPLGDFGSAGAGDEATVAPDAEVRRADDSWAPVVGLSIALALTFLVLIILLALLLAKCCRLCCPKPARKASKYYVNPMPSYKSIEPIYIVTPAGSEAAAFAAPPSATSLYGTYGHRPPPPPPMMPHHHHHHPGMYGGPHPPPPPMGPLVHLPRSRSTTPTSTQRIHRTYHPSGGTKTMHSMHSTPEAHKRDKIKPHRGSSTLAGTYHTAPGHGQHPHHPHHHNSSPESASADGRQSPKKKLSQPPPTIHEAELPDRYHQQQGQQQQMMVPQHPQQQQQQQQQPLPPPHHQPQPAQPQLPFLDPWRKQEVQTREEFIG